MGFVKKSIWLILFLIAGGVTAFGATNSAKEHVFALLYPVPEEGDFLPDTVNVFHIAKDVSDIFMDAIEGSTYNDIYGDTAILNGIFNANYTSNDIGQAYKNDIDQQIKAQKGDFGLNLKADYTENFTPGLSVEEDLTYKRRFYVGLEWDIIKGGLFDASNKIHQLKMESILKEYESLELGDKDNYRYLFNYINYIFNKEKIELLKERKILVLKQLKFTKELYHLRYVGWEKVLKYQEKLEDIEHQVYQYEKFNDHIETNIPDVLIEQELSAGNLPLFNVDLDSLMGIYYSHHSEDTVTQIKLAIYKDNIKWWKDISLKPYIRYNVYMNEFNALRNYGSAGVGLSVPLRFHNKQKLIRAKEMVYESQQHKELEAGDNELVNIYAEFGFKLKQIKSFYYKKMLNDELIRKELVKKEYRDVAFNPVFTLGLIDDKKAIEGEIIDLKKRMYINLVRLSFYLEDKTPTNFITLLKPTDFTGRYEGSVKMFVSEDDIQEHSPSGIVNYLWKNEFIDVIVENKAQELSDGVLEMTEKSNLANIFYSIMKIVPNNGEYPDVSQDISLLNSWENPRIIGLHYELELLSTDDMNEVSEMEISDWVSSIGSESTDGPVRLSIGIPSGLSISLLNRIFNKFDLVFVHELGSPNVERVNDLYARELSLNEDKFVLSMKGTEFADRIHLENYMASLYNNSGLTNFAFSDFSSLINIDYKTFEKGKDINLQPGELVASVRNQIYVSEKKQALKQNEVVENEEDITEVPVDIVENTVIAEPEVVLNDTIIEDAELIVSTDTIIEDNTIIISDTIETQDELIAQTEIIEEESSVENIETAYRIQIAASKVPLKENILQKFKAEDIREIKINEYYKYTIGNFQNETEAMSGLEEYKNTSGNTGAFIVTY